MPAEVREKAFRFFFFGAFAFLAYQLVLIATPFLTALLGAAMLGLVFYPLQRRVLRLVREPNAAAAVSTSGVLLAAVLPLAGLGWLLLRESKGLVPEVQSFLEGLQTKNVEELAGILPSFLASRIERSLSFLADLQLDPRPVLLDNVRELGAHISAWGAFVARDVLLFAFNAAVLVVGLFFAFRDGEAMVRWCLYLLPMQPAHKAAVAARAYDAFLAVVLGVMLTAALEGAAAVAGFLLVRIKLPFLLGLATGLISLLGSSYIVTLPVSLALMRRDLATGLFLLAWCTAVVAVPGHILKPYLIGSRTRLPFVLVFFSLLGGLETFGLLGLILGPVLVATFMTIVTIYREEFRS